MFDKVGEEGGAHVAGAGVGDSEEDVRKKRLRIELRGEYERELEGLRRENDFLKKETDQLKKDKHRKSVDIEKGERIYNTLDRHYSPRFDKGEESDKYDTRRKLSWDMDREGVGDLLRQHSAADARRKSFGEREEVNTADKEGDGTMDRPVERRRWDMEREIEIEKWKRQGQFEKDQERSKWKLEKDKELDRLKKYQELEKVNYTSLLCA